MSSFVLARAQSVDVRQGISLVKPNCEDFPLRGQQRLCISDAHLWKLVKLPHAGGKTISRRHLAFSGLTVALSFGNGHTEICSRA